MMRLAVFVVVLALAAAVPSFEDDGSDLTVETLLDDLDPSASVDELESGDLENNPDLESGDLEMNSDSAELESNLGRSGTGSVTFLNRYLTPRCYSAVCTSLRRLNLDLAADVNRVCRRHSSGEDARCFWEMMMRFNSSERACGRDFLRAFEVVSLTHSQCRDLYRDLERIYNREFRNGLARHGITSIEDSGAGEDDAANVVFDAALDYGKCCGC